MFKQFSSGVTHFLGATLFLKENKMLYFYVWPIVVAFVYYFILIGLIFNFSGVLTESLFGKYLPTKEAVNTSEIAWFKWLSFFSIKGFLSILSGVIIFFISSKLGKYIVLILLAPVFSLLSEKVEEIKTGKNFPFEFIQFLKDIIRGIFIAIRNLILELSLVGLFLVIGLFSGPLAIFVVPILWKIGAYFFGFSMLDYYCERRKMSINESIKFIRKYRYYTLGNGLCYSILDSLPFIGIVFAPINGVVGATLGILDLEQKKS